MCYHKRVVFSCKHFAFGAEVRPCEQQQNYNDGLINRACDTMDSHPLHSVAIQEMCKKCEKKREATQSRLSKLKLAMKDLSETVARLKDDDLDSPESENGETAEFEIEKEVRTEKEVKTQKGREQV